MSGSTFGTVSGSTWPVVRSLKRSTYWRRPAGSSGQASRRPSWLTTARAAWEKAGPAAMAVSSGMTSPGAGGGGGGGARQNRDQAKYRYAHKRPLFSRRGSWHGGDGRSRGGDVTAGLNVGDWRAPSRHPLATQKTLSSRPSEARAGTAKG